MQASTQFILNNRLVRTSQASNLSVLDYLRVSKRLTATKEGCREGGCGACTVLVGHVQGEQVLYHTFLSCLLPLGEMHGKHLVTLEGINQSQLSPVQQALVDWGAIQCGYCTPGFVMALTGALIAEPRSLHCISEALSGNLCRCTGYGAIRRAAEDVMNRFHSDRPMDIASAVAAQILPNYFLLIPQRLAEIPSPPPLPLRSDQPIIAGGSDWMLEHPDTSCVPAVQLLQASDLPKGLKVQAGKLHVSALTTFAEFAHHPLSLSLLPNLSNYFERIASLPVRHQATLGGNLGTASPIGDISVLLLALGAQLRLLKGENSRLVEIQNFFTGYRQSLLETGEVVAEILLPLSLAQDQVNFEKISKRRHLDCAIVNSAIRVRCEQHRMVELSLTMGGVAPTPILMKQTAQHLQGEKLTVERLKSALDIAQTEIAPISDVYGSAAYKRLLARQLIIAHFIELFPELTVRKIDEAA
ncbi:FAD binding domain-containing protein [Lyngbya confervoides]|uniref:FAD binding domain-containing protein n=1 Tax=Lyngbya confervoides BDU141951 TaxID=1574623 RepID=A0ABD4SZ70_9CYAN|nr:FAD binding domain-containing protein [Lyngbya confervoides]MCM1981553.1 FAD binding domain-containing protein [Lyngbya confervoides BDU141951]